MGLLEVVSNSISGTLLFVLGLSHWKVLPPVPVPLYPSRLPLPPPPYLLLPQQQRTQYSQHVHLTPPLLTLQLIIRQASTAQPAEEEIIDDADSRLSELCSETRR